ncbi:hypothetical protein ACWCPX_22280 [Streptomyces olivaceoviridis]
MHAKMASTSVCPPVDDAFGDVEGPLNIFNYKEDDNLFFRIKAQNNFVDFEGQIKKAACRRSTTTRRTDVRRPRRRAGHRHVKADPAQRRA